MNTNYTNKFQRDMMANNIPLSSGEKQSPRSADEVKDKQQNFDQRSLKSLKDYF